MAAVFDENVSVLSESSAREPQNKAAEEGASPSGVSRGNSSLELEDTDIHLLYLSKRAALRGRRRPKSKSGPVLSDNDGCSLQSPGIFLKPKKMKKANKENLKAGLELPKCPPGRSQQGLGSRDLLSSPLASRNDASKTSEASLELLPGHEASPSLPERLVASPRI